MLFVGQFIEHIVFVVHNLVRQIQIKVAVCFNYGGPHQNFSGAGLVVTGFLVVGSI
jgi:hypothetical protein